MDSLDMLNDLVDSSGDWKAEDRDLRKKHVDLAKGIDMKHDIYMGG